MRKQAKLLIGAGVVGTLALATGIGLRLKSKDEEKQLEKMLRSKEFREFYIDKLNKEYDREYAWE